MISVIGLTVHAAAVLTFAAVVITAYCDGRASTRGAKWRRGARRP